MKSRRGKFGGYSLARPMSRIKFGERHSLIDGPLAPIRCVSQTSYDPAPARMKLTAACES